MSKMTDKIAALPGFSAFQPASEEQIAAAEQALGTKFAPDYREVLGVYGTIEVDGRELTGLIESKRLNVVDVTLTMRPLYPAMPVGCYVVEDTYIDGIIICQDSTGAVYELVPNADPKKIAASLLGYLSEEQSQTTTTAE